MTVAAAALVLAWRLEGGCNNGLGAGGNANIQENDNGAEGEERASTSTVAAVPMDVSQDPAEGPRQPQLQVYPRRTFGSHSQLTLRSFNHSWFKQYSWLEYSLSIDAAFCYACRHFLHRGSGHTEKREEWRGREETWRGV